MPRFYLIGKACVLIKVQQVLVYHHPGLALSALTGKIALLIKKSSIDSSKM